jgi:hypothetical protein|tara:strand:- start:1091 stop:1207 length:117 start_codon:yes stop_codon:yes gene_type:complete
MKTFDFIVPSYFDLNGMEIIIIQDRFGNCLSIKINHYE